MYCRGPSARQTRDWPAAPFPHCPESPLRWELSREWSPARFGAARWPGWRRSVAPKRSPPGCRLASRSAAMWLNAGAGAPGRPWPGLVTCSTRSSYFPAAIASMASARADTGRVICLERNIASQTLAKNTSTVTSSSIKKIRWCGLRPCASGKSCQYSVAPARMRDVVWLSPCGMGSATVTTGLPEDVTVIMPFRFVVVSCHQLDDRHVGTQRRLQQAVGKVPVQRDGPLLLARLSSHGPAGLRMLCSHRRAH